MSAIAYDILAVSISMIALKSTFIADRRILNKKRSTLGYGTKHSMIIIYIIIFIPLNIITGKFK